MLSRPDILSWLRENDPRRLAELYRLADATRRRHVGDAVHLRGLIEISNRCRRRCAYCGLRADNADLPRYTMSDGEILTAAEEAAERGYGTVVLQAGEHAGLDADAVADLVRRIKAATGLAVTLSLGERDPAEFAAWRDAGADRYLLRFETSDPRLYVRLHPDARDGLNARLAALAALWRLGYELGSGVMVGIPGQGYDSLADDLLLFAELKLDMIGVGPYLPHPTTPLGRGEAVPPPPADGQVPNTAEMARKVVALTRLVRPEANIPATTALATLDPDGRAHGLRCGANVVMPNLTPPAYRRLYEIYPAKACLAEGEDFDRELRGLLASIGRRVGTGPGDSPSYRHARSRSAREVHP